MFSPFRVEHRNCCRDDMMECLFSVGILTLKRKIMTTRQSLIASLGSISPSSLGGDVRTLNTIASGDTNPVINLRAISVIKSLSDEPPGRIRLFMHRVVDKQRKTLGTSGRTRPTAVWSYRAEIKFSYILCNELNYVKVV